jgi:hypothetical protein
MLYTGVTILYVTLRTKCTVGWVGIRTRTKVPLRFVTYLSKVTKINAKKCFDPVTASSLVKTFWVMHYIVDQNFFPHNMDIMGIKRFQNYKLTLVTKCT